jgi:hypothetical protein
VSSIHLPQRGKYNISRGIKKEEKEEEGALNPNKGREWEF